MDADRIPITVRPAGRRQEAEARTPRVCVVSHHAFGAISGGAAGHAGGVERQTTLLARYLAARGFAVTLLVWNEGQPAVMRIDGVEVAALCAKNAGLPGFRFFHPRWTSLASALRRADADIYYHNCAEYVTGQVALWCRRNRRRFVYSVASDPECDPRLPALPRLRERLLFRYGLRHADRIIVQTHRQRELLRAGWGLESVVLPMPCEGPGHGFVPQEPSWSGRRRVLWVGRISREKRLDRLVEIARRLPELSFEVAGPVDSSDRGVLDALEAARALPNVIVRGRLARDAMPDLYTGAACLVCTSEYEGVPNTFLEAWSLGVPVVSTVDPDGVIARCRLGLVGHGSAILADHVQRLTSTPALWREASNNARAHFARQHASEAALERFAGVFHEALSAP